MALMLLLLGFPGELGLAFMVRWVDGLDTYFILHPRVISGHVMFFIGYKEDGRCRDCYYWVRLGGISLGSWDFPVSLFINMFGYELTGM